MRVWFQPSKSKAGLLIFPFIFLSTPAYLCMSGTRPMKKMNISKTTQCSIQVACSCFTFQDTVATAVVRDDGVAFHVAFPVSCVNSGCVIDKKNNKTQFEGCTARFRFELPRSLMHKWNVVKTQTAPLSYHSQVDNMLKIIFTKRAVL